MTATPYVLAEDHGAIRRIVLNRPQQRNLLTPEMIAALSDALDCTARVIVIASEGPAFCAGHDMKGMAAHHADADGGRAYFEALFAACGAMMEKIAAAPQPVIAEVHAPAVAAGCQLVASCDLALAADTAKFGTTGVAFGLYCSTPAVPLSRTVAAKHANEMLMTGALISADEAARIGLVNRAVPAETLTAETMALAQKIAAHSGAVLSLGKASVAATRTLPLDEAYAARRRDDGGEPPPARRARGARGLCAEAAGRMGRTRCAERPDGILGRALRARGSGVRRTAQRLPRLGPRQASRDRPCIRGGRRTGPQRAAGWRPRGSTSR